MDVWHPAIMVDSDKNLKFLVDSRCLAYPNRQTESQFGFKLRHIKPVGLWVCLESQKLRLESLLRCASNPLKLGINGEHESNGPPIRVLALSSIEFPRCRIIRTTRKDQIFVARNIYRRLCMTLHIQLDLVEWLQMRTIQLTSIWDYDRRGTRFLNFKSNRFIEIRDWRRHCWKIFTRLG